MPYLTCDPTIEDITAYLIDLDGQVTESPPNIIGDGSKRLWMDLTNVSEGEHTVIAYAKNMWKTSGPSEPLTFSKNAPTTPSGLALSLS